MPPTDFTELMLFSHGIHAVHAPVHHAVHAPVVHAPVVHAAPVVAHAPVHHAVHAAPAYHAPVHAGYVADDLAEPSPYSYTYAVADDYSGAAFQQAESMLDMLLMTLLSLP